MWRRKGDVMVSAVDLIQHMRVRVRQVSSAVPQTSSSGHSSSAISPTPNYSPPVRAIALSEYCSWGSQGSPSVPVAIGLKCRSNFTTDMMRYLSNIYLFCPGQARVTVCVGLRPRDRSASLTQAGCR